MAIIDIIENIPAGTTFVHSSGSDQKITALIITNTEVTSAVINIKKKFNGITVQRFMKDTDLDPSATFFEDKPIYIKANTEFMITTDKNIDICIEGESI